MTVKVVRYNCEFCLALCGMIATVDGERILKVKGDRAHPASQGYTCTKGRAIAERHHSSHRLDRPRLQGEQVRWERLLDDLSARLQKLIRDGGPDRIGSYSATGGAFAGGYVEDRFFAELGSGQRYSTTTLDIAPQFRAAELVTGFPEFHPVWSPDTLPSLAVLVGVNPTVSGGYIGSGGSNLIQRLRRFRDRGGELWVVDPRRTKTAQVADRHLALRPGTDVFLVAWLVRELLEKGFDAHEVEVACDPAAVERLREAVAPFALDAASGRTGLARDDLLELLAAIRRHRKLAILGGTGVGFQPTGVLTYWLMWAIAILTGSLDTAGGLKFLAPARALLDGPPLLGHAPERGSHTPGPTSRPDLDGFGGELPGAALADEIESGQLRALFVFGGNPLIAIPDPDRMRAALKQLEVLAVFDTFDVELAKMATHAIPCTWLTERASFLYVPMLGVDRMYWSPSIVTPGAERRHPWWVLAQLGRRLGMDILAGLDPDTVDDETVVRQFVGPRCDDPDSLLQAGSSGVEFPTEQGWFHQKVLPDGRWRLAPRVLVERLAEVWSQDRSGLRLVSGRIMNKMNSAAYSHVHDRPPPIHVSTDAASERGIETGDTVRVSTALGSVEGTVRVDETLSREAIWVSHGWLEQNVQRLLDPTPDRLTAQPYFTGLPVKLERVPPRRPH